MGQEIQSTSFSEQQAREFRCRLDYETGLLARMLADGQFSPCEKAIGCELEAWLIDSGCNAAPRNEAFIQAFDDGSSSAELGRFNIEFNTSPQPLSGTCFGKLEAALAAVVDKARATAARLGLELVLIGTLPTLRDDQLNLANLSRLNRYLALNDRIIGSRKGRPIRLEIRGRDHLVTEHTDVMLEAATTSFQIHWQLSAQDAPRYYNAALIASAPVLAAACNSPFLFERDLWAETRIPLFEQAIPLVAAAEEEGAPLRRVGFGSGWMRACFTEVFDENLQAFDPLLPILLDEPAEQLPHLRLHNGTVWRWNRPLIGFDERGTPHFRLEHRVLPAGPTIADMVANAAFFYGLVEVLAQALPLVSGFSFATARENFYRAARSGLSAELTWLDGRTVSAANLLPSLLRPAREGLERLGIETADIERFLGILGQRVASGQTASEWQRRSLDAQGGDFAAMTRDYLKWQKKGCPVHEWKV